MTWVIGGMTALLGLFSATAVILLASEMRRLRAVEGARPHQAVGRRLAEYVGPVDRRRSPLPVVLRILAEFGAATLGFPGLGWMVAGRISVGLPLMLAVPAAIWLFYPLYVAVTGTVVHEPLRLLWVLPAMALISAGALAVAEIREPS